MQGVAGNAKSIAFRKVRRPKNEVGLISVLSDRVQVCVSTIVCLVDTGG